MIKIAKPAEIPDVLLSRGKKLRASLCSQYTQHAAEYDSGERKFTFQTEVYGHETVKKTLIAAQHSKCCFCESKTGLDGDVEHYRPKAGYRQSKDEPLLRPGYYWLAYDWNNLLLACPACNQRFKKNYFPLANPNARAKSHKDDVSTEEPLFINPAERDPEQYIGFRYEISYPIDDNPLGTATIEALGLNREVLNEKRRDRLGLLTALHDIVQHEAHDPSPTLQKVIDNAKALLEQAVGDSAEFAAMTRCAVKANYYIPAP
ncbi:MAG TPA: hypothetical protein VF914_12720 [Chloroflexia bacterium]